ncbi:MAG: ribonuclease III [Candidatus Hydrogenedentota bacterium]
MNEAKGDEAVERVLRHLGVQVKDETLIEQALTHSSVTAQGDFPGRDYESLEFLGDAALGLAVADYLLEQLPGRSPGEYSQMRAHVVNRRRLAEVAEQIELGPAIRLGKGEEQSGGRNRPALLADCVEALIGAVYLDQGWETASAMVRRLFAGHFREALEQPLDWDYKSRLQQYCQGEQKGLPEFRVIQEEGPDHRKEFEVEVIIESQALGRGLGSSKKEAEQNAARAALQVMGVSRG